MQMKTLSLYMVFGVFFVTLHRFLGHVLKLASARAGLISEKLGE